MSPRIALFHATLNAVAPVTEEWRITHPEIALTHYLDEGLLPAIEQCGLNEAIAQRLEYWVDLIFDDGADALLLTCSSVTPLVPALRAPLARPIVAIDEAMIEEALAIGPRIAVVATLQTAADTTEHLLREAAGHAGLSVSVCTHIVAGAFEKLSAGDIATHDAAIHAAIASLPPEFDVVLLAQVSMSRALRSGAIFPSPVLSSGPSAVRRTFAAAVEHLALR